MLGMSSAAMAGAEFHPSTYTTYMQHPPYKGYVKLLSDLPQDEASYTEIGMVRIDVDEVRGFDDAMDRLKAMAAQHGGMAIIPDDDARMMASGATPKNATATAVILNN
ncbi:MAG: hypothetical protein CMM93_03245 [Rickettsiales bacterium]|nr:hypothetical protein [Rickettsiales bacterium]